MGDIIDLNSRAKMRKASMLESARRELRKWGFSDLEIKLMEKGSSISTNDPRVQRMVADALVYRGWKFDWDNF